MEQTSHKASGRSDTTWPQWNHNINMSRAPEHIRTISTSFILLPLKVSPQKCGRGTYVSMDFASPMLAVFNGLRFSNTTLLPFFTVRRGFIFARLWLPNRLRLVWAAVPYGIWMKTWDISADMTPNRLRIPAATLVPSGNWAWGVEAWATSPCCFFSMYILYVTYYFNIIEFAIF